MARKKITAPAAPVTLFGWLEQNCPLHDLREKPDPRTNETFLYMPIDVCKMKLDQLRSYGGTWGYQNFQSKYFEYEQHLWISASVDLCIEYIVHDLGYSYPLRRTFAGTTTFRIADYWPNNRFDSIAKSLAIVNAASDLGNQFGRNLYSKTEVPVIQIREGKKAQNDRKAVKLEPDAIIRTKYNEAAIAGDTVMVQKLETLYEFNYVNNAPEAKHNPDIS